MTLDFPDRLRAGLGVTVPKFAIVIRTTNCFEYRLPFEMHSGLGMVVRSRSRLLPFSVSLSRPLAVSLSPTYFEVCGVGRVQMTSSFCRWTALSDLQFATLSTLHYIYCPVLNEAIRYILNVMQMNCTLPATFARTHINTLIDEIHQSKLITNCKMILVVLGIHFINYLWIYSNSVHRFSDSVP